MVGCFPSGKGVNELFVEATKKIKQASTETNYTKKRNLKYEAWKLLQQIVKDHPNHDLAVKISSGQKIGIVDPQALEAYAKKFTPCEVRPTKQCILELAMKVIRKKWSQEKGGLDLPLMMLKAVKDYSEGRKGSAINLFAKHVLVDNPTLKSNDNVALLMPHVIYFANNSFDFRGFVLKASKIAHPDGNSENKDKLLANIANHAKQMSKRERHAKKSSGEDCMEKLYSDFISTRHFIELYCAQKIAESLYEFEKHLRSSPISPNIPQLLGRLLDKSRIVEFLEFFFWFVSRNTKYTDFVESPIGDRDFYIASAMYMILKTSSK